MPLCSFNCCYSSFTLSPTCKFTVTHKLFRNYTVYYLSIKLQVSIFALLGPQAAPASITGVLTLILRDRRPVRSPPANDANAVGSARAGTGGLPRERPASQSSLQQRHRNGNSHCPAGQGLPRESFVQNQGSSVAAFHFPTFSRSQRTCGFPLELALQPTTPHTETFYLGFLENIILFKSHCDDVSSKLQLDRSVR